MAEQSLVDRDKDRVKDCITAVTLALVLSLYVACMLMLALLFMWQIAPYFVSFMDWTSVWFFILICYVLSLPIGIYWYKRLS